MTLGQLLDQIAPCLAAWYTPQEQRAIGNVLLREVAGVPPYWAYVHRDWEPEDPLRREALAVRWQEVLRELSDGVPLQYVLGFVDFGNCRLAVDRRVLIPRPETEELLKAALLENVGSGVVLDVGTGSGCLAVCYKKARPEAQVFACDVSPLALEVACENAARQAAEVTLYQANLLEPAAFLTNTYAAGIAPGTVRLLLSNPPYVTEKEKEQMHARVLQYEPPSALFVPNEDPLRFYRALAAAAVELLLPGGGLQVEINEAYGASTRALFESYGFNNVVVTKDLFGKDRFLHAQR